MLICNCHNKFFSSKARLIVALLLFSLFPGISKGEYSDTTITNDQLTSLSDLTEFYSRVRFFYPVKIKQDQWTSFVYRSCDNILKNPSDRSWLDFSILILKTLHINVVDENTSLAKSIRYYREWKYKGCGACDLNFIQSKLIRFLFGLFGPFKSQLVITNHPYSIDVRIRNRMFFFQNASRSKKIINKSRDKFYPWNGDTDSSSITTESVTDVILLYSIVRQFYAYPDALHSTWNDLLRTTLQKALKSKTKFEEYLTLRYLLAQLNDGHAFLGGKSAMQFSYKPNVEIIRIDDKLILKKNIQEDSLKVPAGSELLKIDDKSANAVYRESLALTPGASSGFKQSLASKTFLQGTKNSICSLDFRAPDGAEVNVKCIRDSLWPREELIDHREFGDILYVNVSRVSEHELISLLKQKHKGIIFDFRQYPTVGIGFLKLLSKGEIHSQYFITPIKDYSGNPANDTTVMVLRSTKKQISCPFVFLANSDVISGGETYLSIVKNYKLGLIIGDTTAGTNGNIGHRTLPGGFSAYFSCIKVLNQDGSSFHGHGIPPDLLVRPTLNGIKKNEDELLEKALEILRRQ